jgi:hypothetical protein
MVDQKGSLGFVGDVFEVMAQVDRRLTGSLGLITQPETWGITNTRASLLLLGNAMK